jgi:uncharacterized protein
MESEAISVEVVYARNDQQTLIALSVNTPITVEQAILQSGVLQCCPEIDLQLNKVGVFGQLVKLSDPLEDGDRVEIYRPLLQHPMDARRQRATR